MHRYSLSVKSSKSGLIMHDMYINNRSVIDSYGRVMLCQHSIEVALASHHLNGVNAEQRQMIAVH